jgi:hypothetical protein
VVDSWIPAGGRRYPPPNRKAHDLLKFRGSVHHSKIRKKKIQQDATMYQHFYYSIFIWSSTCFGRHTAHHQEPKIALASSGFSYVEGCWTCSCWTLSADSFRLLMMGGVSSETCWASYKYGIINFDTLLHLVGFSLWIILWCTDPRTSG